MTEILINQSVAILCDGNNIERSIHEMSKTTKAMINSDAWLKPGGALPTNMNIINNNLFADNVYGNHCFDGWSEWFWNIISGETELAWIGEKDPKATILDLAAATTKFANELQE